MSACWGEEALGELKARGFATVQLPESDHAAVLEFQQLLHALFEMPSLSTLGSFQMVDGLLVRYTAAIQSDRDVTRWATNTLMIVILLK